MAKDKLDFWDDFRIDYLLYSRWRRFEGAADRQAAIKGERAAQRKAGELQESLLY